MPFCCWNNFLTGWRGSSDILVRSNYAECLATKPHRMLLGRRSKPLKYSSFVPSFLHWSPWLPSQRPQSHSEVRSHADYCSNQHRNAHNAQFYLSLTGPALCPLHYANWWAGISMRLYYLIFPAYNWDYAAFFPLFWKRAFFKAFVVHLSQEGWKASEDM